MKPVISKTKSLIKWFWHHKVISVIMLVFMGFAFSSVVKANTPPKVETAVIKKRAVESVVEASGKVLSENNVDLTFSLPGKVIWVGVKKGDIVQPGQALATMDQRELENALKNKMLTYMQTRWDFEQLQDDHKVHGNPLSVIAGLTDAEKRALEKSQFGLDQSVLDVELASIAKEKSILSTPIEGTVIETGNLYPGETLSAAGLATKIVKVTDLERLYFQANVDEADYAKVKTGQRVHIRLDSFPNNVIEGTVSYVGKAGIKKTGGSVQIPVDISFNHNTAQQLLPELNGDVEIVTEKRASTLSLEKKFVHKNNDSYYVNILKDNKLQEKQITVGLTGIDYYEILNGISDGDIVVNEIRNN